MPRQKLLTRSQAIDFGDKTYVGSDCRYKHGGVRYTASKHCVECQKNHYRRWKDSLGPNFRKAIKQRQRRWKGLPEPTRPEPETCECCGVGSRQALCLDHDHATGVFRGWLCHKCNLGIGKLGDNLTGVMQAVNYLQGKSNE